MLLAIMHSIFSKTEKQQDFTAAVAKSQAGDEEALHDLLIAFTPFIKKTASFVCKKYISEQEDEFSVAFEAFHQAVMQYDETQNAALQTFAHLLIRRKLIDFMRKEGRRKESVMSGMTEDGDDPFSIVESSESLQQFTEEQQAEERRKQIGEYAQLLKPFGLSFEDLVKASPSHIDARQTAMQIAEIIAESEELCNTVLEKKKLPIKELIDLVEVSRKTVERHRKYIIALIVLMKSDLYYIKEYLKGRS